MVRQSIVAALPIFGGGVFDKAFSDLMQDELLTYTLDTWDNPLYFLTEKGLELVESWTDQVYDDFAEGISFPKPDNTEEQVPIPASDRTVPLNHNQPDYQDAVAALDKVIEEFRNDHRLDNEDKERKDAISKFLEGGRRLLDGKEISVEEGEIWLVKPLKWIVGKFTEGTLQAAAAKALEFICKLIGVGN